jgi:hypothetical protein
MTRMTMSTTMAMFSRLMRGMLSDAEQAGIAETEATARRGDAEREAVPPSGHDAVHGLVPIRPVPPEPIYGWHHGQNE